MAGGLLGALLRRFVFSAASDVVRQNPAVKAAAKQTAEMERKVGTALGKVIYAALQEVHSDIRSGFGAAGEKKEEVLRQQQKTVSSATDSQEQQRNLPRR